MGARPVEGCLALSYPGYLYVGQVWESEEAKMARLRGVLCGAEMLAVLAASAEAFADCYVDSVEGNDSLDGSSEATAVQS
jgi:hypothetical protein